MNIIGNVTLSNKINVLSIACHEAYESIFCQIPNLEVTLIWEEGNKKWNPQYRPVPSNYILGYNRKEQIKLYESFSHVISHNKFDQFRKLYPLSRQLQVPLISVEHTCKMPHWTKENMKQFNNARGECNIFITKWSLESWEWEDKGDTVVIPHAIQTDIFKPSNTPRTNNFLTVGNDMIGRSYILGYDILQETGLNIKYIGDTFGLSKPAENLQDLVNNYQNSKIYLNPSRLSPIPMSLLESMSCGCVPIALNTCAIPDYIQDGHNGFLVKDAREMRDRAQLLLIDEELREEMSKNAVQTIKEKCSISRFVNEWQQVFEKFI